MTDPSKLLAEADAISVASSKVRVFAQDAAANIVTLAARVAALEAKAAPVPPPIPPVPPTTTFPAWGVEPYAALSAWHKPVPADAPIHPNSGHMINDHETGGYGGIVGWGPIAGQPAAWLWPREQVARLWVPASTPLVPVVCSYPTSHTTLVPIPPGFVLPHDGSDNETRTALHVSDGRSFGGYQIVHGAGWSAVMFDLRKPAASWQGVADGSDGLVSSGASRIPFDAGAISPQDFANCPVGGWFSHALNINISSSSDGSVNPKSVAPAGQGDGKTPGALGIPLGCRIVLRVSLAAINARPEPEWQKQIMRTAVVMGMIPTDTATAQGVGDGLVCCIREDSGAYPFPAYTPYANGIPADLMTSCAIIDWTKWS